MTRRNVSLAAGILIVLVAYHYFASYGEFAFHSRAWNVGDRPGDAYYASLAEGFRRGGLNMAYEPDPRLMAMPNPYDHDARKAGDVPYAWDASYFNGRYYLYFTPLPALLIYLPHRLVYGDYPDDQLAAAIFAAWAVIMAALFVRRALAGRALHVPLWFWISLLGLGNVTIVVLVYSRVYEVATFCGMAMTATWAWSLLRFIEKPSNSRLIWTSIWLALSIAARPNLGLLGLVLLAAIYMKRRGDLIKALAFAAIPLLIAGGSLLAYNYARFHDPLEFGHRYQLTYQNMAEHRVCSCRTPGEAIRLVHTSWLYIATPLNIGGDFPFVRPTQQRLDPEISFDEMTEAMAGLGAVAPLTLIGTFFAAILGLRRNANDEGTRAGLLVMAAAWLALFGLSVCWYASARYEADFMLLMSMAAVVCIEIALTFFGELGVSLRPLRIAIVVLAVYSMLAGVFLGFADPNGAFKHENAELFHRIESFFK